MAEDDTIVGADGFIAEAMRNSRFERSPIQFWKVLINKVRRNCEAFRKTHIGKILGAMLLEEDDFEGEGNWQSWGGPLLANFSITNSLTIFYVHLDT